MRSSALYLLIFAIMPALPVHASEYYSPRSAGLGGAGHAAPLLNDSILLNPSYASFVPTYTLTGSFLGFSGPPSSSRYRGRNYNVSFQDGRSELFQAGASFTQREDLAVLQLGASRSFIKQTGFGISGKYYRIASTQSGAYDMSVSATWLAAGWLQLAFIADNVITSDEIRSFGGEREFILGTKFNLQMLSLFFDPHLAPGRDSGKFGHETGIELTVMSDFYLRLGAFNNAQIPYENARGRGYGFGVGWLAPKVTFDFAINRSIEPTAATAYSFGANIFF